MPAPAGEILAALRRDLDSLLREATAIRLQFGSGQSPKFHMSLYALLMAAFSQVDLYSSLRAGSLRGKQTPKMRAFLARYTPRDEKAISLAIQLYRHTLMHTGRPRELLDDTTGTRHYFLLHWGREVADETAHFTVQDGNLTLNLECLLEDVSSALERFADDVSSSSVLAANVERAWPEVILQRFAS